jgi:hypothetical protein
MAKKISAPQTSTGGERYLVGGNPTYMQACSRLRVSVGFSPTSPFHEIMKLWPK